MTSDITFIEKLKKNAFLKSPHRYLSFGLCGGRSVKNIVIFLILNSCVRLKYDQKMYRTLSSIFVITSIEKSLYIRTYVRTIEPMFWY